MQYILKVENINESMELLCCFCKSSKLKNSCSFPILAIFDYSNYSIDKSPKNFVCIELNSKNADNYNKINTTDKNHYFGKKISIIFISIEY